MRHRPFRSQDLHRPLLDRRRATAEMGDLGVAQRAFPQCHVVHLAVKAGGQHAIVPGRADQEWRLEAVQRTVAPLFVDQHAVHEQLQVGAVEAEHDVMPLARSDQCDRYAQVQHAGARLGKDGITGAAALVEADHRGRRPGAPTVLQQRPRAGQPAGAALLGKQVVPGRGRPRLSGAPVVRRLGGPVGPVQDLRERVAAVVAGEQGCLPASGRVAQPHAQAHRIAAQAGISGCGCAKIPAGEPRDRPVSAAGNRGLSLCAPQRNTKLDRTPDRQPGGRLAVAPGHVPGGQRVGERTRINYLAQTGRPPVHCDSDGPTPQRRLAAVPTRSRRSMTRMCYCPGMRTTIELPDDLRRPVVSKATAWPN